MTEIESATLVKVRAMLKEAGLPPETGVEYFIAPGELDTLKARLQQETQGHYHVITRPEGGKLHVIAIINVRDVRELFQQAKLEILMPTEDQAGLYAPAAGAAEALVDF